MRGDVGTSPSDTLKEFKQARHRLRNDAALYARYFREEQQKYRRAKTEAFTTFWLNEARQSYIKYHCYKRAASGIDWSIKKWKARHEH